MCFLNSMLGRVRAALGECNPFLLLKKHIRTHTFTYIHIHAHILSYIQIQHDTCTIQAHRHRYSTVCVCMCMYLHYMWMYESVCIECIACMTCMTCLSYKVLNFHEVCIASVAQWYIWSHMRLQTGVRDLKSSKAFC